MIRPLHSWLNTLAWPRGERIALAAIMLALLGCSDAQNETAMPETLPGQVMQPASASYSDNDNNEDATSDADPSGDTDDPAESPRFMGSPCTDDCSGHEAGYQWAEDKGIDDPDDCSGNSNSFVEGCRAYAEEQ